MMTEQLAPASLPPGHRVYAIGDIHGCSDQLDDLHRLIARDLATLPPASPAPSVTLIHLGDYLDRGPDSAGVITRIHRPFATSPDSPTPPDSPIPPDRPILTVINLAGNHEDLFLAALDGKRGAAELWMDNGGVPALASWGVPPRTRPRDWPNFIPAAQITALRNLPVHHSLGGYFFVHAGIRPGVPLADQTRQDMLWIRQPFLTWDGPLPAVVVHGHTPHDRPIVRANRIGIDTGAVLGGELTCVVLEADRLRFLSA